MTIRRGLGDRVATDSASGTRPVLDYEGMSNLSSNLLEDHARDDIACYACRNGHNNCDVARRPILRRNRCECGEEQECARYSAAKYHVHRCYLRRKIRCRGEDEKQSL